MSQQVVVKCDVCGRVKGEGNKWVGYFYGFYANERRVLTITQPASGGVIFDCCSDTCLQKVVAEVVANIQAMGKEKKEDESDIRNDAGADTTVEGSD